MKKDIAITIQNFVQYQSVVPALKEFKKRNYSFDIYIPIAKDPWGLDKMFNEIYEYLLKNGYNPKREIDGTNYKILLEPYPMDYYFTINHQYRLKYTYGVLTSKPNPCLKPEENIYYDGILCVNNYEEKYLSVYSKPYVVGSLKFINYQHKKNNKNKKILLYLPTYGNLNSIQMCSEELIKLKDKYYIITKSHHGTNYFDYEQSNEEKLENLFDEYYPSNKSIAELLELADIVLSDNSGSIAEAIYVGVPVAIMADNINPALGDFNSFQFDYVKNGSIPYSADPKDLNLILKDALSKNIVNKQKKMREELFPVHGKDCLVKFMNVIENYLNDKIDIKYYQLHHILVENYSNYIEQLNSLKKSYDELKVKYDSQNQTLEITNEQLSYYKNGKLYSIAKKLYEIKQGRK